MRAPSIGMKGAMTLNWRLRYAAVPVSIFVEMELIRGFIMRRWKIGRAT